MYSNSSNSVNDLFHEFDYSGFDDEFSKNMTGVDLLGDILEYSAFEAQNLTLGEYAQCFFLIST